MFTSCENSGFRMRFSNGYTVSCQWSERNYCSRKFFGDPLSHDYTQDMKNPLVSSNTCEIMVDDPKGRPVTGKIVHAAGLYETMSVEPGGQIAGWVNADCVGKLIGYIASLPVK